METHIIIVVSSLSFSLSLYVFIMHGAVPLVMCKAFVGLQAGSTCPRGGPACGVGGLASVYIYYLLLFIIICLFVCLYIYIYIFVYYYYYHCYYYYYYYY